MVRGRFKFGPVGSWLNQVPSMDLPPLAVVLKPMIFAIELLGLCIKNGILAVRLLGPVTNFVFLAVLGLIVASAQKGQAVFGTYGVVTTISVLGSTAFSCLELFVAFLQAYVFTFLSALFIAHTERTSTNPARSATPFGIASRFIFPVVGVLS